MQYQLSIGQQQNTQTADGHARSSHLLACRSAGQQQAAGYTEHSEWEVVLEVIGDEFFQFY
jgi:hypothetical protein